MHFAYMHFTNAVKKFEHGESTSHFPFQIVLFDILSREMHDASAVRVVCRPCVCAQFSVSWPNNLSIGLQHGKHIYQIKLLFE